MQVKFILSSTLAKCVQKAGGQTGECQLDLPEGTDLKAAMKMMKIPKHGVKVISKKGTVIDNNRILSEGEEIKIVTIASGG